MSASTSVFNVTRLALTFIAAAVAGIIFASSVSQAAQAASRNATPNLEYYLGRSQRLMEQRKLDQAQRVLEDGVAAFKKAGVGDSVEGLELQLNLGAVFFAKGDPNEALKRFNYV